MALLSAKFANPDRLRPHRPQCARPGDAHRRAARLRRAQRKIRECNTGVLAARREAAEALARQAQARQRAARVLPHRHHRDGGQGQDQVAPLIAPTEVEVLGVNDKLQLAALEAEYRRERAQALMLAGVTVIDPARLDVRGSVLRPRRGARCERRARRPGSAGMACGRPNCVLSQVQVGAGTEIKPNCVIERAQIGEAARCRTVQPRAPRNDAARWRAYRQFRRGEEIRPRRGQQGESLKLHRRRDHRAPASTSAPARSPAITTAPTNGAPRSVTACSSARAR
jgi:hypothetical protein